MEEVLVKAGGFLFMIALGFVLKKIGLFSVSDSGFLSRLILKVTLPMSIVSNFKGLELSSAFLTAILLGFGLSFASVAFALLLTRKQPPARRAFFIINTTGYNIGLCTLPYMSGFFSAEAVAVMCMFDVGNAIMCFGITYACAMAVSKGRGGVKKGEVLKTLFSSMPFVTYLVMILLTAGRVSLPQSVYTIAGMAGQANGFLAMFLIGLLFEPKLNRRDAGDMLGVVGMRLFTGVVFSFLIYHFLPVPLLYRQILSIIVFSPILSAAPVYTEHCGYPNASAAVLNSMMLPASLVVMTLLMMGMDIF